MVNIQQTDSLPTARYASSGILAMLTALLFTTAMPVFALTLTEVAKLLVSDGAVKDELGNSVAISGDWAVIGAHLDDDNGLTSGSAYVFERDAGGSWNQVQKLLAGDGAVGDALGESVAISGTRIVIGAYGDDDNGDRSGSAYVFERNAGGTWNQVAKLLADDSENQDEFGSSVAISRDWVVIGAPANFFGPELSSAYVFERDAGGAWNQVAKLLEGAVGDFVGQSVAISGNLAMIGAIGDDQQVRGSGAVYVFERDVGGTWTQIQKLLASDPQLDVKFGQSVSISGDRAVIGAHLHDNVGFNSGAAYVFERNTGGTWTGSETLGQR